MTKFTVKKCSECGQQLRFPDDIGGSLWPALHVGKSFNLILSWVLPEKVCIETYS